MAVSELLRGLAGALVGFLATWILLLCLVETHERSGQRGVAWSSIKGNRAEFTSVWVPLIPYGTLNGVAGFLIAVRLTRKRQIRYAAAGAVIGVAIFVVVPTPLRDELGKAGVNTDWILRLVAAFLGAAVGTLYAARTDPQRGPFDD